MDVFIIPVGRGRQELYCEPPADADDVPGESPSSGFFARLWQQFRTVLRAAEERQHHHDIPDDRTGWFARIQDRLLGWLAQRIAEQRLLWNLRAETEAVIVHPGDMAFEDARAFVHGVLVREYRRHRLWLVFDTVGLLAAAPLVFIPGPNVLGYYFAFRVIGHWLSMRGALQGQHRVHWTGRAAPALNELRDAVALEADARDARIHDIASRLRLRHLCRFVERVAMRHA